MREGEKVKQSGMTPLLGFSGQRDLFSLIRPTDSPVLLNSWSFSSLLRCVNVMRCHWPKHQYEN